MLDPDTLDDVGNLVAMVYSELEAEMCDVLIKAMLENDIGFWKAQASLAMLAQSQAPQLRMVLERYKAKISKAVRREVEQALTKSDENDLNRLQAYLGYEIPKVSTVQLTMAAQKIGEMLERDNIDMLTGARQVFYKETSAAIAQVTGGLKSPHEATWAATRRLARHGIDVVQYKDPTTGNKTVRNRVDVAVRRHVRSQMAQSAAERTMQVCESTGCGFVEVSSHVGARPSHQDWEGRVYSLNGRVTVDGVTYEDFGESTGYYGEGDHGALGDRLQGVNCRHHFGPWLPGMPRAFHPNPRHPSGKSNTEIYELTQKQRTMERNLRDTKRELIAALENYGRYPNEKTQLAANELKEQLKSQNDKMKAFLAENKGILTRQPAREWVGNMPQVKVPSD